MKRKSFAVIGAGRFGSNLALALSEMGHDVLIVDNDEKKVQELSDKVTHAVQADSTNEQTLKTLGITNFDVVVVGIGVDLQASILTSLILKELGAKYILAKARTNLHGKLLEKIGVDRVVFPERDMGLRIARHLADMNVLDCIDFSPDYSVTELIAPKKMIGKTLRELDLRARYEVNVIAIRSGEQINISPLADDMIKKDDLLIVIGENKAIEKLVKE
ncbi:MAG: TrkA family potassium uptake protein [Dethiobacter sp.]|jgi:trk system potassium uptake protein TrkA|nr:MAG: TrkA family potassium uptake protein [Dethiobacter sp.]